MECGVTCNALFLSLSRFAFHCRRCSCHVPRKAVNAHGSTKNRAALVLLPCLPPCKLRWQLNTAEYSQPCRYTRLSSLVLYLVLYVH